MLAAGRVGRGALGDACACCRWRRRRLRRGLSDCRAAALDLYQAPSSDARFLPAFSPELDIVVWIPRAATATAASRRSRRIFDEAAGRNLHLALAELPADFFDLAGAGIARDADSVTCLRSVLMKPEHRAWTGRILEILGAAADAAA